MKRVEAVSLATRLRGVMAGLLILGLTAAADAQDSSQLVKGIVRDKDGQPVADAEVWLHQQKVKTAADGTFTLEYARQALFGQSIAARNAAGDLQGYKFYPWQRTGNEKPPELVELTLEPFVTYRAKVVDGDEKPLSGVKVIAIADHSHKIEGETNADGLAELQVPAAARLRAVFAKQAKRGFDYVMLIKERDFYNNFSTMRPPPPSAEPILLKLDGARTLDVKLVDGDGQPMADIGLYPWLFNKTANGDDQFNTAFVVDEFSNKTNSSGIATFDWLPTWEKSTNFTFWPMTNHSHNQRATVDMSSSVDNFTIELARGVMVGGIARKADGTPATGVMISLRAVMPDGNQFGSGAQTGPDGRYQIETQPNSTCMLVVDDANWAAPIRTGVVVEPKKNVENIDFELRPATKVTGRVTVAGKPVANQSLSLTQSGMDGTSKANVAKSAGSGRPFNSTVHYYREAITDADGRYEFNVGPGRYLLKATQSSAPQQFEIRDEKSKTVDFAVARPDRGPFSLHVVSGTPPADVADAVIEIRSQSNWWNADVQQTDRQGKLNTERSLSRTFIYARSADGTLGAVVEVGPDDPSKQITIKPCGTAKGRLVDPAGKPIRNTEVYYGVRPDTGITLYGGVNFGGGQFQTDGDGKFTIPSLVVDQEYSFDVPQSQNSPNKQSRRPVAVNAAGESDLGDVVMVSIVRPESSTPAAAAIASGLVPPEEQISWPRVLMLGNMIGIPLLVVAFFAWRRMAR